MLAVKAAPKVSASHAVQEQDTAEAPAQTPESIDI
jgi:hypothetical protein